MKYKEQIIKYCKMLANEDLLSVNDCVSLLKGESFFATKEGVDLKNISENDVVELSLSGNLNGIYALHKALYESKEDCSAIITNHAPHCVVVAKAGVKIPAVLDDLAQIIGPTTKVAKSSSVEDVLKTLKGRNACLIKNGGVIATGRTLDEAYTGSLVLEKGAKTFIETSVLGGTKPINAIEGALMHFIYKKKYSKADQAGKIKDQQ